MHESSLETRLFLLLILSAVSACGDSSTPTAARESLHDDRVRVVVEPLRIDHAQTRLEAVGTSRAMRSIELYPAAAGEVTAVHFEPGQFVAKNELLLELERREEELAVALAEVRLEDAERLYDRYQRSADSGAVLPTTIDAARTAVESARIELQRAEVALDFRSVRAPFAGYIGITEIDPGDRINSTTLIATLDDRRSLLVSFKAPEAFNGQIAVGDEVAIAPWDSRTPAAYGEVEDIGSRIDPVTRSFEVRGRVGNENDRLRPGMSFRVSMDLEGTAYPVVAETAVQWGADGAYIWSVANGTVQRIPVNVVQRIRGSVLVDTDLTAGELVVVEGIQRMREGIDVTYDAPSVATSGNGDDDQQLPPPDDTD